MSSLSAELTFAAGVGANVEASKNMLSRSKLLLCQAYEPEAEVADGAATGAAGGTD